VRHFTSCYQYINQNRPFVCPLSPINPKLADFLGFCQFYLGEL
jgi:hypothetical protein